MFVSVSRSVIRKFIQFASIWSNAHGIKVSRRFRVVFRIDESKAQLIFFTLFIFIGSVYHTAHSRHVMGSAYSVNLSLCFVFYFVCNFLLVLFCYLILFDSENAIGSNNANTSNRFQPKGAFSSSSSFFHAIDLMHWHRFLFSY